MVLLWDLSRKQLVNCMPACGAIVRQCRGNSLVEPMASSGRISTVLSSLEKKGWVTRDIDSKDRRIIRVNLTDSGREQSHRMIEEMRSAICWIFSQMGERRTREFVDLVSEFTIYMSICHPGRPRPTAEQVREAFVERDKRVAEHMAAKRAEN